MLVSSLQIVSLTCRLRSVRIPTATTESHDCWTCPQCRAMDRVILSSCADLAFCGCFPSATCMTQPRMERLSYHYRCGGGFDLQRGYFLGRARMPHAVLQFYGVPLGAARPGTASTAWIINKSWIFEDLLAMVHGEYPRQMIWKGSRFDDIQANRPNPNRSQLPDPTSRDLEHSLAIPTT